MPRTTAATGFFLAFVIALMLSATTPVAAGAWEDGIAAYQAGDYRKAVRLFKRSVEQGDVRALGTLAMMYSDGKGVTKDEVKAVHWYSKAAKQGDISAQYFLGHRYYSGEGVPKDYVRAYAWLNIAAAQGDPTAPIQKGSAANRMTPAQIAEAQKLSREYWEKYVVPFQKE